MGTITFYVIRQNNVHKFIISCSYYRQPETVEETTPPPAKSSIFSLFLSKPSKNGNSKELRTNKNKVSKTQKDLGIAGWM